MNSQNTILQTSVFHIEQMNPYPPNQKKKPTAMRVLETTATGPSALFWHYVNNTGRLQMKARCLEGLYSNPELTRGVRMWVSCQAPVIQRVDCYQHRTWDGYAQPAVSFSKNDKNHNKWTWMKRDLSQKSLGQNVLSRNKFYLTL